MAIPGYAGSSAGYDTAVAEQEPVSNVLMQSFELLSVARMTLDGMASSSLTQGNAGSNAPEPVPSLTDLAFRIRNLSMEIEERSREISNRIGVRL